MRTHLRDPDCLTLAIARGPVRGETSMQLHHVEDGLTVVMFDDWIPVPELGLHAVVETAVRLWVERGPIAATAYMSSVGRRRPHR